MANEYYMDVSAKMIVDSENPLDLDSLKNKLTVVNKGGDREFIIFNCLVENVSEIDPVSFYNLKRIMGDSGEVTESKYSGLTKQEVTNLKKDLKNLDDMLSNTHVSSYVNSTLKNLIKTLKDY